MVNVTSARCIMKTRGARCGRRRDLQGGKAACARPKIRGGKATCQWNLLSQHPKEEMTCLFGKVPQRTHPATGRTASFQLQFWTADRSSTASPSSC